MGNLVLETGVQDPPPREVTAGSRLGAWGAACQPCRDQTHLAPAFELRRGHDSGFSLESLSRFLPQGKQWVPGTWVPDRTRAEQVSWILRGRVMGTYWGGGAWGSAMVKAKGWHRGHVERSSSSRKSSGTAAQGHQVLTTVYQPQMSRAMAMGMPSDGTRRNALRSCPCQGPARAPPQSPGVIWRRG